MPKPEGRKSISKVKKEATHEFFNKKRSGQSADSGRTAFTFNKAPINKDEAKKEMIEGKSQKNQKRSAFTAKLYRDDNDLEEMKVLGGEQFDSDVEEGGKRPIKQREVKAHSKSKPKQDFSSKPILTSKIGRLSLTKGSVAMFAVSEVHEGQYAIVNHTRNVKGFISLKDLPEVKLQPGQLVIASITSVGQALNEKGHNSSKLQLSIEPASIYRSHQTSKITPGMFLQAIVESKEEKGYFLNIGFKDGAKGFVKFNGVDYAVGELIQVTVASISNKLVKCDPDVMQCVQSTESVLVNEHTLRPGFLVNAKIAKLFENGLELSFLGGMTGTVFADHTGRESISTFKVGEKVKARVTGHDVQSKITTLSLLDHIIILQPKVLCELGTVFEKAKVQKLLYGGSYQVKAGNTLAFLHKSHLPGAVQKQIQADEEALEDDQAETKKVFRVDEELEIGQTLDKVRVKELNFFDGTAHLTMRSQIVNSPALDYSSIEIGQFVNATILSVNEVKKIVTLSLNDFVKGTLRLEHMADYPVKVIPPKFTQTGKQIKVRVFSLEERSLVFTKKDSLMKHDVQIFKSLKKVAKGEKVIGVVVAQNDHGHIVKSFGDVKGLLTFADIKENQSKKEKQHELKTGSIVKAYVLFNKKGSGLALTLDKKKARKTEEVVSDQKTLSQYFPTDEECSELKTTYNSLLKHSADCVGKVMTFKVSEQRQNFYVVKTVLEKKQKFAVLPKPLSTAFGISLPLDDQNYTFEAYVFCEHNKIPAVVLNPVFCSLNALVPQQQADIQATKCFIGLVESTSDKLGVQVKFPTFAVTVSVKDLQHTEQISKHYPVGSPVMIAHNKTGRLSCKQIVLDNVATPEQQRQFRSVILNGVVKLWESGSCGFKVGQKLTAAVQMIKEYGLILKVDETFTGFIVNEQKASDKQYKTQQSVSAVVLDVDYEKKIIDLSERLVEVKQTLKQQETKAFIELTKDSYMIVSMKGDRSKFGMCVLQKGINDHSMQHEYEKYRVGDEIDVALVPNTNETKNDLLLMTLKAQKGAGENSGAASLKEGALVNGVLKSIKDHVMFIQVGNSGKLPQIGRLLKIEAQQNDFQQYKSGDRFSVKVLRIVQEHDKTWIELTRRKEHLDLPSGILNDKLAQLLSLDTIKEGAQLTGIITDVSAEASCPVQFQISPFVSGKLIFSDVVTPELLQKQSLAKILSQFKIGGQIDVVYKSGQFYSQKSAAERIPKKGDLCVARYVKVSPGYGVTVQLNSTTFGVIEICELSDDIAGNLTKQMKSKNLFLARVIDSDKKGRLMLSARESVVSGWTQIFGNSTAQFQQFDGKNQKNGNLRNKILKFGPKLAVSQGDLFTGYVTNISKAGCFVQIGHNCSVRIGLNELDDSETFDFKHQMPIGRQVAGRITKCMDLGEEMRFNASLRKSLVLYGVHLINRNQLKPDDQHTCFVLAVASDLVFAQLKGSYLKLKVYGAPKQTTVGSLIDVKLTKVQPENIKGDFIGLSDEQASQDQTANTVYNSILEESRLDIAAAKDQNQNEIDLEEVVAKKRHLNAIDEQIRDLETLQELENKDASDEAMDDSDAEDMKRIISKNHGVSSEDDSDEEMKSEDENGESDLEDDDEEMESQENEDESGEEELSQQVGKRLKGKKALREQITQEKKIRAKEASMRSKTGSEPTSVNDFERLLVADQDQSYLWIQYMAFMLDKLDIEAARRVAERAVKSIGMTAEADKLNLWIAYMNLENQFGSEENLQVITRRALEINDQRKVYLQLINLYRSSNKLEHVEAIFKKLCKKYFAELDIWTAYIEFLFEAPQDQDFTAPKVILQRSLQALPKNNHINVISKFGMLEYKHGRAESGRTMFEGIVTNYPKRMDIWSIYMDMEVKHGGKENLVQARHLFERCLSLAEIQKKPKKMKLVFRKYMEFESANGNKQKLAALRQRVEEYLENAFKKEKSSEGSGTSSSGSGSDQE